MSIMNDLLANAADSMSRFRSTIDERAVAPPVDFDTDS